jgi:hypothetical protein
MNRSIAAAALMIATIEPVFAAATTGGSFQVRRATSGHAVATAAPCATITTSPYDSDLASMLSATSFYYSVYDASGNPLQISVIRNTVTNTLRISFNDGNAGSAPVSASSSSVTVAPSTINADGLQAAVITIVPRDVNGVLLGTGLSIAIDSSLLWPAHLTGAIADLGDGSYRAAAVAPVAGTGTVRTNVEGISLTQLPTITSVATTSLSLRDQAIQQLQSLIGPGGPMASLQDDAGENSPQAQGIADALARANAALQTLANDDPTRDDNVMKTDFDAIFDMLEAVLESHGVLTEMQVNDVIDHFAGIARLIAEWHIERAVGSCGVCDGSEPARQGCARDRRADGCRRETRRDHPQLGRCRGRLRARGRTGAPGVPQLLTALVN